MFVARSCHSLALNYNVNEEQIYHFSPFLADASIRGQLLLLQFYYVFFHIEFLFNGCKKNKMRKASLRNDLKSLLGVYYL